ncbi:UNKNOWN [Stylonychia lemnae]|uniref:Uncharacterized protein n=1 Tax=Stylonychia lemnae TaxID=5949 RepID=A0A078A9R5_STYLE|nr:UNKNOWN [Stylonychia lemnae]|eukprot:CDW78322.1 UNKNOWN [Stylonychia lemnae]
MDAVKDKHENCFLKHSINLKQQSQLKDDKQVQCEYTEEQRNIVKLARFNLKCRLEFKSSSNIFQKVILVKRSHFSMQLYCQVLINFLVTSIKHVDEESNLSTQRSIAQQLSSQSIHTKQMSQSNFISKQKIDSQQKTLSFPLQKRQSVNEILQQCKELIEKNQKSNKEIKKTEIDYEQFKDQMTKDQNTLNKFIGEISTL